MGKLLGIAVREKSRGPMLEVTSADVTRGRGVLQDFRGKPGRRQVTVLSVESWKATCEELGQQLPWTTRRANLLVEGIDLCETTGSRLWIGDVVLQITGETDPCSRMDEAVPGLREALTPEWRGGVCCRVINNGAISTMTTVTIESRE